MPGRLGTSMTFDRSRTWVRCRCPCGGEFTAGSTTDGEGVVLHTTPPCRMYLNLDVTPFLAEARRRGAVTLDGGGGN